MAWNKKAEVILATLFTLLLVACGGDSGNDDTSVVLASSLEDLEECTEDLEGDTVFVKSEKSDFVCINGEWANVDSLNADKDDEDADNSSSSALDGESSSSFVYEQDSNAYVQPPIVAIKNKSISGVSQKGPFVTGSTVKLYELDGKTYSATGKSFPGKIASDDGKFSVSSINLESQYALLEANGYFRNEVSGEKSNGTITLNALTDLSDRKSVNVNLLTHLEYDRVLYLVNTGINVQSAKKQAEAEILNAFGISGEFENSEDLNVFSKGDGNAALLAFSVLMLGSYGAEREEDGFDAAELTGRLSKFALDIEKDGSWDDEVTKIDIADWVAIYFDPEEIRENIEEWNLDGDIPDFEKYVYNFWYMNYGLGKCNSQNNGEILPIKNELSYYFDYKYRQYICKDGAWRLASLLEIDSYKAKLSERPKDGDFWTGPVTGYVYKFDEVDSRWVFARDGEVELGLGACTHKRGGELAQASNGVYYICQDGYDYYFWNDWEYNTRHCLQGSENCYSLGDSYAWKEASEIEYDTYGKPCTSKEVGSITYGAVVAFNKYECRADMYYSDEYSWVFVYDSYLEDVRIITEEAENAIDGELRKGYEGWYKYDAELDRWEIANANERYIHGYFGGSFGYLGGCTTKRIGEVNKSEYPDECGISSYVICGNVSDMVECDHDLLCSAHDWNYVSEKVETYGKICSGANEGEVIDGLVTAKNKYYCTGNEWVTVEGEFNHCDLYLDQFWKVPKEIRMNPDIKYGTMTDARDGKTYRTTTIGNQVWMAENLNYADSSKTTSLKGKSWCHVNKEEHCAVAGRLYTWAAAIDSVALANDADNPQTCGYGVECSLPATVQGICPEGWHLPSNSEWQTLFSYVSNEVGSDHVGTALKTASGWYLQTGDVADMDAYGFSALPAGGGFGNGSFSDSGYGTLFWSSSEDSSDYAYFMVLGSVMVLGSGYEDARLDTSHKFDAFSVRCLQNN